MGHCRSHSNPDFGGQSLLNPFRIQTLDTLNTIYQREIKRGQCSHLLATQFSISPITTVLRMKTHWPQHKKISIFGIHDSEIVLYWVIHKKVTADILTFHIENVNTATFNEGKFSRTVLSQSVSYFVKFIDLSVKRETRYFIILTASGPPLRALLVW